MPSVIIYSVFSLILFGIGVFFYKLGIPNFSTGLGASVYIASHLIVLGALALFENAQYATGGLKFLVIGGIFSGIGQIFFFSALRSGQIHVVVPIRNLSLIVTVLLGIFILSENITIVKSIGLLLGIAAIVLLSL